MWERNSIRSFEQVQLHDGELEFLTPGPKLDILLQILKFHAQPNGPFPWGQTSCCVAIE